MFVIGDLQRLGHATISSLEHLGTRAINVLLLVRSQRFPGVMQSNGKKKTVETAISVDGLIGPGLSSTSAQTRRPRDCPFWVAFLCMLPGKAAGRQRVNKDGSAVSIFQGSIRG